MVATASEDETIRLWETWTGNELLQLHLPDNTCYAIAFSPDGKTLASGFSDGTAIIWALQPHDWVVGKDKPTDQDLEQGWAHLRSTDGSQAYRAIWELSRCPDRALPLLRRRLHPIPKEKPERIQRLVADLDHDDFERREAATRELTRLETQAESALREALAQTNSEEARTRIRPLLQRLDSWVVQDPESLRTLRAIWVLQRIGTPDARSILVKLARGAPQGRVTQEAQASLQFIDRLHNR